MESINPSLTQPAAAAPHAPLKIKRSTALLKVKPSRLRILPITMTMLALLLVVKLNAIYFDSMALRSALVSNAQAEDAKETEAKKEEAAPYEEKPKDDGDGDVKKEGNAKDKKKEPGASAMRESEINALKKLDAQTKYNQIELDLLQNLSQRRDALDVREKELGLKEKTLESTEKRISARIDEMKLLQVEVQQLIEAYKKHQDSDVKSLVKIYENMKPVDAAAIFNELEMPILLSVIDAMSERKVAPVLAAMSPTRAKDVTEELAEMRKVKALPTEASAVAAP